MRRAALIAALGLLAPLPAAAQSAPWIWPARGVFGLESTICAPGAGGEPTASVAPALCPALTVQWQAGLSDAFVAAMGRHFKQVETTPGEHAPPAMGVAQRLRGTLVASLRVSRVDLATVQRPTGVEVFLPVTLTLDITGLASGEVMFTRTRTQIAQGLRYGRVAAWFAILAEMALFLPPSALMLTDAQRLELHLGLAAAVLVTWLAGSFADAQAAARRALDRRNRLLFQAERLKTLRAMSVAVIHEISQPLSTLAIEANHLRAATASLPAEICGDIPQSAALVDRKARTLADLVRRLRRFGGREVDTPSALPVDMLIDMAQRVVLPELRRVGARLEVVVVPPDLVVQAQEIELTQALVNLLRNAISAAPDGLVRLKAAQAGDEVRITLRNAFVPEKQGGGQGMGVGLIIARTIVEAHGGTLMQEENGQEMVFTLRLPLAGGL